MADLLTEHGLAVSGPPSQRPLGAVNGTRYFNNDSGVLEIFDELHGGWHPVAGVVAEEVAFTETNGAGVYTGTINLPPGATLIDVIVNVPKHWQGKHVTSAHKPAPPKSVLTSLPDFIDPDDIDDDDRQTSTGDDDDISFNPNDFDSAISFDPAEFDDSTTSTGAMPASDFIGNPRLKSRFDEMGLSIDQLNQRLGLSIQPQQPSKPAPDLNPHTFDAAAHSTIAPMAFEITSNPRMQNRFKDLTLEEFNRRLGFPVIPKLRGPCPRLSIPIRLPGSSLVTFRVPA